jgi:predicted metalloprotease
MQYNDDAQLDTSEVQDTRRSGGMLPGSRGGQVALGGGGLGVVGLLIAVLVSVLGGGGGNGVDLGQVLGGLGQSGEPATADNSQVQQECKTGADANTKSDCAAVADVDSIQAYWKAELPKLGKQYVPVPTVWFSGQVSTGCGAAASDSGPFYCPADKRVYIDLTFYEDLQKQFGAEGGLFVNAYVLAHEYGHHVQDLLGIEAKVRTRQGATSDSVRLELQADCFAGVWAKHATEPGADGSPALISNITQDDFDRALDTAGRIGDDWIQKNLGGGTVQQDKFTHGSSAQRRKWLTTGYQTGDPNACDTFGTNDLG